MREIDKKFILIFILSCVSTSSLYAQNIDVNFTATIRETTCDMRITGGTGDGKNNTIPIGGSGGKTSLDKIISEDASVSAPFSLDIITCPSSMSTLKTTVSGTQSNYNNKAITNGLTGTGASTFVGVTLSRSSGGDAFTINATDDPHRIVWTNDEIKNKKKVDLVAQLVPTYGGDKTTPGDFSAVATFNFTYD